MLKIRKDWGQMFEMFDAKDYAVARSKYRPSIIEVLWIAESPPSSQGFFYFDETTGRDHLFRETMKAVRIWPDDDKMPKGVDKRRYLREFQSKGYFLVDTCELPVDELDDARRREAIERGAMRIVGEVMELRPKSILVVKSNVFQPVKNKLEKAELGGQILNKEPIPFPSHGWQSKYRSKVRHLLEREKSRAAAT